LVGGCVVCVLVVGLEGLAHLVGLGAGD